MNNAKSREHARTCRKARAIFKLRYKEEEEDHLSGSVDLTNLPTSLETLYLHENCFVGKVCFKRTLINLQNLALSDNAFSGCTDFSLLPDLIQSVKYTSIDVSNTQLSGKITWGGSLPYVIVKVHNPNVISKRRATK
ncbi:hypothetical protein XU18_2971 [Perkinsela sp. CCAP 1560/4]|nr:hypothetical protein XU18_2971 [Perkinsela sp. CCAP 1560/4]|eukprot:KNH06157.1 hypothetical protein XU18_2971 [Perkinsela sp. CCAP 1560/4]